jgi:hypothetical protein
MYFSKKNTLFRKVITPPVGDAIGFRVSIKQGVAHRLAPQ